MTAHLRNYSAIRPEYVFSVERDNKIVHFLLDWTTKRSLARQIFNRLVDNNIPAWQDGGMGGAGDETLVTVLFADKGKDTEVHLIHERFSDAEKLDKHNQGWLGCLENLAARLS